MRRLRKVKISAKYDVVTVAVAFEKHNQTTDGWDQVSFRSEEPARPELHDALSEMGRHLLSICEFPFEWRYEISVQGVTITYSDDDIQGVVISGRRELKKSNAPLILNSPHISREPYSESSDGTSLYPPGCAEDLDTLERAALAYVDGARLQRELDFNAEQDPAEATADFVELNR